MPARVSRQAYKELRLQQLRSFCETVRLGSLKAAAVSLGLSQPTVGQQVHALERDFGEKLIERHSRGCRPTETGRLLAEHAAPLVAGIESLRHRVQQAQKQLPTRLTVAAPQRILVDDLPQCLVQFERQFPHVLVRLLDVGIDKVTAVVEAGEADLGLIPELGTDPTNPWVVFEPSYELDLLLVTPLDHPLAHQRHVRPHDLLDYPLVNSPDAIPDRAMKTILQQLGVFETQPRRVEAFYTAVIRRYVELGFGIGLVVGMASPKPSLTLHERSMSRDFGRTVIYQVWRKGVLESPARAFADIVKALLGRPG